MKITKWFLSFFLTLGLIGFHPTEIQAKEAFDILDYHVEVVAEENGVLTVTESLSVQFFDYRHGIYLSIPQQYDMDWGEEGQKSYTFPITDIHILSGHSYSIDSNRANVQIQLGNENYYADEFETYQISYKVHTKDFGLDGKQAFYYNLIYPEWDTTIHHASFKVTLPMNAENLALQFYTQGNSTSADLIISVQDNVIEGERTSPFGYGEGITLFTALPEGTFKYPVASRATLPISVGSIILLLICAFFYFNKKEPLISVTTTFTAPDGLTSADVGYILDGAVDNRDVISLILQWADQGYLTIQDEEEELTFTKIKELEPELHESYELLMFKRLFKTKAKTTTTQLQTTFYETMQKTRLEIPKKFSAKKRKLMDPFSSSKQALSALLTCLGPITLAGWGIYHYFYSIFPIVLIALFTIAFMMAGVYMLADTKRKKYATHTRFNQRIQSFFAILLIISAAVAPVWLAQVFFEMNNTIFNLIIAICTVLGGFFAAYTRKYTDFGAMSVGVVAGLYNFILIGEKDRMDVLVKDNPSLFYNILPYAYAFGLTDVWSQHFADMEIAPPVWYNGDTFNSYYFMHRLNRHMNHLEHVAPAVSANSRNGGGSFGGGGGFSGGGFSGGGFGGSRGGSW